MLCWPPPLSSCQRQVLRFEPRCRASRKAVIRCAPRAQVAGQLQTRGVILTCWRPAVNPKESEEHAPVQHTASAAPSAGGAAVGPALSRHRSHPSWPCTLWTMDRPELTTVWTRDALELGRISHSFETGVDGRLPDNCSEGGLTWTVAGLAQSRKDSMRQKLNLGVTPVPHYTTDAYPLHVGSCREGV